MNKQKNVPFFNYPNVYTSHRQEFLDIFNNVCERGAFIMQSDLADFEKNLASYSGSKYAVGVANATDGLQMLLMAAGISVGDEVIISSHTMVATASAIHFAGGVPVPVDAGADHLIDCEKIEDAITDKTKAIMPTQLNGRIANMDKIQKIADKHGLMVFEDAAQALGAKYKGKAAGNFGLGGCISFYPAKVLGCFGDAGAILCNDEEIYKKLLLLRDHGRDESNDVVVWGLNSRLDNLQAAFLDYSLKDFDEVVKRRREIASIYNSRLKNIAEIVLPPAAEESTDNYDIFQNYEIESVARDSLKEFLAESGIGTLIQWGGSAIHHFKKLGFTQELAYTDKLFDRMLMVPMNMSLTDDDVNYVCDKIIEFTEQ